MIKTILTFTLCCCILITGCNFRGNTPTKVPRSEWINQWLARDNPDCQPPCYNGVIPGQSSLREAEKLLKENGEVTEIEVVAPIPDVQNHWEISWKYLNSNSGGRLETEQDGDMVDYIALGFPSNNNVALEEIIAAYGSPSHVVIWTCSHGPCDVDIIFLDMGMGLRSLLPRESKKNDDIKTKLTEQTNVSGVYFFEKGLEGFRQAIVGSSELSDHNFHVWEGYQQYSYSR